MKLELNLDNIGELDHGVSKGVINETIRQAYRDTIDRGSDGKTRKAVITISMTQSKDKDYVAIHVDGKVSMPTQKTGGTLAKVAANSNGEQVLQFEPLAPDNPDQGTLDFEEPKKRKHPEVD